MVQIKLTNTSISGHLTSSTSFSSASKDGMHGDTGTDGWNGTRT